MVWVVSVLYCMGLTGWFAWCIAQVLVYGVSAVLYGYNGMVCMVYCKGISVWCWWYHCCIVWV